ncbi:hypothetical protein HQ533_01535 [Candidatus Woesearchaeota archaeon]|nr:hypothetical protein [Candidatus Woesearchaeota archaeon]
MGFLGFLKKKDKEKSAGLTPANQDPEQLKQELLGKKEEIPKIENIPLPPEAEEIPVPKPEEEPSKTEMEEIPSIEEPISSKEETPEVPTEEAPPEPEQIEDVPVPSEPGAEETPESGAKEPETEKKEEPEKTIEEVSEETKPEEVDFSLPEFTDEEMNLAEKTEEESKEEEKEEETAPQIEAESTFISSDVEAKPLVKAETAQKGEDHYMNVESCRIIFEKIHTNQDSLAETGANIQKHELRNRSLLQNYKSFHDNLDLIQEKLMEIDGSLFER